MSWRYKITIEYVGTNYCGWAGAIDVVIEKAIYEMTKENVRVFGAGRTDAGVHALGQVAHFDLNKELDLYKMINGLNHFLNKNSENIIIVDAENVSSDFHARFSAIQRQYRYRILNRSHPTIIDKNRVWHVHKPLDFDRMKDNLKFLVGKRDWSSFRATDCQAKSPIKTIDKVDLYRNEDEIIFEIKAKSFLYHQVRNIVGTLVDIGLHKYNNINDVIEAKDRTRAGKTAPACGLYFVKVIY